MHKLLLLLVAFSLALSVSAQIPKGFKAINDNVAFEKKLTEAANAMKTIKCDFVQEKNLSVLSEKIVSKGQFMFKKENMVRMEYKEPVKMILIINKDKIKLSDEHKTSVVSAKKNKMFETINRIILDCVQGTAMRNKDFKTTAFESDKQYLLQLNPSKKDVKEYFTSISIFVDKKDYTVLKMEMNENGGDNTVINFINRQLNIPLEDALF